MNARVFESWSEISPSLDEVLDLDPDTQEERLAAVKLLNTALVGHPSEKRLSRAGRVLARLQHPNIAHLLDAGVGASSQPYLISINAARRETSATGPEMKNPRQFPAGGLSIFSS